VRSSETRPTARLVVAAAVVLAALGTGCGGGETDEKAQPAGEATTTTTVATTTSPPGSSTTAVPTASTTQPTVVLGDSPPFSADGPSGAGCAPGPGGLPDGWWYGVSVGFNPGPDPAFTLDLACYFVGEAAYAEGERRGEEVTNDYLVVNENPTLRTVPVAAGATAICVDLGSAGLSEVACSPSDIPDPETPWAVWFRVVDGEVDRLVEQYAP
jgi:hypothetical protein